MSKLSLGGIHSAVLDDAGVAYTFGDNRRGARQDHMELAVYPNPRNLGVDSYLSTFGV